MRKFTLPAHVDPSAPFLGLLGDTAAGRVVHHLIATDDTVTVSELARATDLSRLSARKAVRALVGWGVVEAKEIPGGWTRYRVNKASPVNLALELLIGALNDAQHPGQGLFESYAETFAGVQVKRLRKPLVLAPLPMATTRRRSSRERKARTGAPRARLRAAGRGRGGR